MSETITIGILLSRATSRAWLALSSALAQSNESCEILISDNCSGIDYSILNELCTSSNLSVRVVKQESRLTVWENFLFCYKNSMSEYFMWLGDDDFLTPYAVDILMKNIQLTGSDFSYGMRVPCNRSSYGVFDLGSLMLPNSKISRKKPFHLTDRSQVFYKYTLVSSFNFPIYSLFRRPAGGVLEKILQYVIDRPFTNYFDDQLFSLHLLRCSNFSLVGAVCYGYDNGNWDSSKDIDSMSSKYMSSENYFSPGLGVSELRKTLLVCHLIDCLVTLPCMFLGNSNDDSRLFMVKFVNTINKNSRLFSYSERRILFKLLIKKAPVRDFIVAILNTVSVDDDVKNKLMGHYSSLVNIDQRMLRSYSVLDLFIARVLYSDVYKSLSRLIRVFSWALDEVNVKNFLRRRLAARH